MGISGLLPLLRSIQKTCHVRDFKGQTLGVDAYVWLHRGIISCATELALGKPSKKYVHYAMRQVKMLQHFGVTPFLVFDGDFLPSKAGTEVERERKREESRKAGLELLSMGKSSLAHLELQKSIDVTPMMALELMEACRAAGVECMVAPYEADAQLYYLEKTGVISGVVSEDSDLLVFGCKTLITKLDKFGECISISREDFGKCRDITLAGWTDKDFRYMAIMSGCDYLDNIPKMGLKTAHRFVRRHKEIERIIKALQYDGNYTIPDNYIELFKRANTTFLHQRVFCPKLRKMVMCNEPEAPLSDEDLVYIGAELEVEIACAVADGTVHPITKERMRLPTVSRKKDDDHRSAHRTPSRVVSAPVPQSASIKNFFKPESRPQTPQTQTNSRLAVNSSPLLHSASVTPMKRVLPFSTQTGSCKLARRIDDMVFEAAPETSRFFAAKPDTKRSKVALSKAPSSAKKEAPKEVSKKYEAFKEDDSESNKENIDPDKQAAGVSSSPNYPLEAFRHKFLFDGLKDTELNRRRSMPALAERRSVTRTPTASLKTRKSYGSVSSSSQGFESAAETLESIIKKPPPDSPSMSFSQSSSDWPEFVATGRKSSGISADPFARARNFR